MLVVSVGYKKIIEDFTHTAEKKHHSLMQVYKTLPVQQIPETNSMSIGKSTLPQQQVPSLQSCASRTVVSMGLIYQRPIQRRRRSTCFQRCQSPANGLQLGYFSLQVGWTGKLPCPWRKAAPHRSLIPKNSFQYKVKSVREHIDHALQERVEHVAQMRMEAAVKMRTQYEIFGKTAPYHVKLTSCAGVVTVGGNIGGVGSG